MMDFNESNPVGVFGINSRNAVRKNPEDEHQYRCPFSRDRDRILYSKEFRRLSGKTQVFVVGFDDHCRTRLTHTIEVAQIAKTISKNLGLNVELTDAIALGHDVGHTPFGHAGEKFLNLLMSGCYKVYDFNSNIIDSETGFKHNWQGLRVVSELEHISNEFRGLNLTEFTRWGILNHTSTSYKLCDYLTDGEKAICGYLHRYDNETTCTQNRDLKFYSQNVDMMIDSNFWSFEAYVVAISDEIAQRHHDIEDGIEAGILTKNSMATFILDNFSNFLNESEKDKILRMKSGRVKEPYLPQISSFIVNLLTTEIINNSSLQLENLRKEMDVVNDFEFWEKRKEFAFNIYTNRIGYREKFAEAEEKLKDYLYQRIINSNLAQKMDGKSNYILRQITKAYITNPQQLPDSTIRILFKNYYQRRYKDKEIVKDIGKLRINLGNLHKTKDENYKNALLRTICDYIAGMTDNYALKQYNSLYGSDVEW